MWIRAIINFFRKTLIHKNYKCVYSVDLNLKQYSKNTQKIAGIVGWLNEKSSIDLLIKCALNDGMHKVLIYSCLEDPFWYYNKIEPLIKNNPEQILFTGCVKNKQYLFDSISDLYISSNSPFKSSVKLECNLTNTNYHEI